MRKFMKKAAALVLAAALAVPAMGISAQATKTGTYSFTGQETTAAYTFVSTADEDATHIVPSSLGSSGNVDDDGTFNGGQGTVSWTIASVDTTDLKAIQVDYSHNNDVTVEITVKLDDSTVLATQGLAYTGGWNTYETRTIDIEQGLKDNDVARYQLAGIHSLTFSAKQVNGTSWAGHYKNLTLVSQPTTVERGISAISDNSLDLADWYWSLNSNGATKNQPGISADSDTGVGNMWSNCMLYYGTITGKELKKYDKLKLTRTAQYGSEITTKIVLDTSIDDTTAWTYQAPTDSKPANKAYCQNQGGAPSIDSLVTNGTTIATFTTAAPGADLSQAYEADIANVDALDDTTAYNLLVQFTGNDWLGNYTTLDFVPKAAPTLTWSTATDAGYYASTADAEDKTGVIRFLAAYTDEVTVSQYGFYLVNSSGEILTKYSSVNDGDLTEKAMYTDLVGFGSEYAGKNCHAKAFVVLDGQYVYSDAIDGTADFTNYLGKIQTVEQVEQ